MSSHKRKKAYQPEYLNVQDAGGEKVSVAAHTSTQCQVMDKQKINLTQDCACIG